MTTRRLVLSGLGAGALSPVFAAAPPQSQGAAGQRVGYFPNAILDTHDGRKVRFYDDLIKGKLVVINMLLTECAEGLCPTMTANLVRVQEALGKRVGRDIFMYSITLRPEFDTPLVLRAYARQFGVKPGWTFLRGEPQDTEIIRRKLGFYDLDPKVDADVGQHTGLLRIGDEPHDHWCMMPALSSPRQIVSTILSV
ncbi:SCO family protein [Cupriavidus sp. CV2]|uniref:SCO family protein n=1 Tax=Cupriavidus ulmosensis TaxID=3065913 RepID=UPI00296AB5EA|nr:SCO family protein [Cupriavidus sp. CV2]MDW3682842.1 SCO family protein [Cupriavidus sp. CV2]